MKIGVEVEMYAPANTYRGIANNEGLNFTSFKSVGNGLKVMMSEEYYPSTIEYNFEAHEYSPRYIQKVRDYMQGQIDKYNLQLHSSGPGYVGMHVHIFDLKIRKIGCETLLETSMNFIDKYYNTLNKDSKERLFRSHQLWRNYMYNKGDGYLDLLCDNDLEMAYPDYNQHKKKYNPCILSSRSAKGKPRSIEIRILPNEFLMDASIIFLLDQIKDSDFTSCNVINVLESWIDRRYNQTDVEPVSVVQAPTYVEDDTDSLTYISEQYMANIDTIRVMQYDGTHIILRDGFDCMYNGMTVYVRRDDGRWRLYKTGRGTEERYSYGYFTPIRNIFKPTDLWYETIQERENG